MSFELAVTRLKKLGFKVGPTTKSRIFTMTYSSATAKGYISIRYDYTREVSAVIAEFYGRTKSKGEGIGGNFYLVQVVPKRDNVTFYRGLNEKKCKQDFLKLAAYMAKAVPIMQMMGKF